MHLFTEKVDGFQLGIVMKNAASGTFPMGTAAVSSWGLSWPLWTDWQGKDLASDRAYVYFISL